MTGTVALVRPDSRDEARTLSEIITFRLSAQDVESLNLLVRQEQREASVLIRMALRAFIEERLDRTA